MGAPVVTFDEMRLRIAGSHIPFSSICEGASTKSHVKSRPYGDVFTSAAIEWPNSWKNGSTSACVKRASRQVCSRRRTREHLHIILVRMPSIPMYIAPDDAQILLDYLNGEADLAWLVSDGGHGRWIA